VPVILDESPEEITMVKWGLIPHWDKAGKMRPQNNARIETAAQKPTFREAYKKRHCLVLADGFYEWHQKDKRKIPYRILLENKNPFAMAGLWEVHEMSDGTKEKTFAILTTESNTLMQKIHERMPVILRHSEEHSWLVDEGTHSPLQLMVDSDDMTSYEVSTLVNSPKINDPKLLVPVKQ
jgi:putative SOS response-associated peptidase YedK